MESNHTGNSSAPLDPYHGITSPIAFKIASFVVFALIQVFGNALVLGLMWFEKYGMDQPRSLLNQLMFRSYALVLVGNVTMLPVDYFRIVLGRGLPAFVCEIKVR